MCGSLRSWSLTCANLFCSRNSKLTYKASPIQEFWEVLKNESHYFSKFYRKKKSIAKLKLQDKSRDWFIELSFGSWPKMILLFLKGEHSPSRNISQFWILKTYLSFTAWFRKYLLVKLVVVVVVVYNEGDTSWYSKPEDSDKFPSSLLASGWVSGGSERHT